MGRRWWRRLYWLRRDCPQLARLEWSGPSAFVGFGGIGDELLATCVLRELHRAAGRTVPIFARYPELFAHNPDVARIWPADPCVIETAATWGLDLRRPCEWQHDLDPDRQEPPIRHIIAEAAYAGGVRGRIALRPYLDLTASELEAAAPTVSLPVVTIQSSGATARYFFRNKEWGPRNFQSVVDALSHRFQFIQLGAAEDPPLQGAIDRRGLGNLRDSAAVIARSAFFVGQVGLLMHMARAVDRRAVIIFGGREWPQQSGYPCNENLFTQPPCAPCWRMNGCDFNRVCLSQITPASVLAAVDRLWPRLTQELEITEVDL